MEEYFSDLDGYACGDIHQYIYWKNQTKKEKSQDIFEESIS